MVRYLLGLILIQVVALVLFAVNADASLQDTAIRAGLPCAIVTVVMALWFSATARSEADRRHADMVAEHAREREALKLDAIQSREQVRVEALKDREKIQLDARRAQDKAIDKVRRAAEKRERRVGRGASVKVGMAFFSATALGVLMLLTELLTLGLLTIASSASALGGYLLRWKQDRANARSTIDQPIIEHAVDTPRVIGSSSVEAGTSTARD